MARRRMIDPNIWESEDVARLSMFARLLLIGMFSNADDDGRGRANPAYLRSTIFKYDEVEIADVKDALESIKKWIRVTVYEVDGQSYYCFDKWSKWQRVDKPTPSILPAPPDTSDYENKSMNESQNDSKNDSETDSETDSRLKEKKRSKEKRIEQKQSAGAHEAAVAVDPLDATPQTLIEAATRRVLLEFLPCGLSGTNGPNARTLDEIEDMMTLPSYGPDPPARADMVIRAMRAVKDLNDERRHWGTVKGLIRKWQRDGEGRISRTGLEPCSALTDPNENPYR